MAYQPYRLRQPCFSDSKQRKTLHVALHHCDSYCILSYKFRFHLATNQTETDVHLCQVDLCVEVNG